jgi:multidrug efflux pump
MTSQSRSARANVTLQFELGRDINGAAREVQAAIQAARSSAAVEPAQQPRPTAR